MVFTRLIYAWSVNRSCSGHVAQVRQARSQRNYDRAKELLKVIYERYLDGAVRLNKMKAAEQFIYVRRPLTLGWTQRKIRLC